MRGRGSAVVAFAVVATLALLTGALPVLRYVDAVTVPSGTSAQDALVLSVDDPRPRARSVGRARGRVALVERRDGTEGTVFLAYRWDYPEPGDTVRVYEEDGELRTTSERSWLTLGLGLLALLGWPGLAARWWRRRSRAPGAPPGSALS